MMNGPLLACLKRIACGIAQQFGPNCEVVIHDLSDVDHSIVAIENCLYFPPGKIMQLER